MVQTSQIREHMKVVGSDGRRIGRVDHVVGEDIELAQFDLFSGLRHHLLPFAWVESVDGKVIHINRTRRAARSQWREKH